MQSRTDTLREVLYLELDVIFDIRLAILTTFFPPYADAFLKSGQYMERVSDQFDHLDSTFPQADYEAVLAKRDLAPLLGNLKQTRFVASLQEHIRVLHEKVDVMRPQTLDVVVNTLPYQLSDSVKATLLTVLGEQLGGVEVRLDDRAYEELTPAYFSRYTMVGLYDFDTWINTFLQELSTRPIPQTEFMSPAINREGAGSIEKVQSGAPQVEVRTRLAGHLSIDMAALSEFSVPLDLLTDPAPTE